MRNFPSLFRLALPGALLALGACDDAPLTAPAERPSAAIVAPLQLNDPGIDQSDTWLVAEATTTTTTTIDYGAPTFDPATGRMTSSITLPTVTENTRTEAGYGSDGVIRIGTWYAGDTAAGVARVQIVGDSVTYYDAAGAPRADLPGADLVATLGSFANDVVTDSIIIAEGVVGTVSFQPAALRGSVPRARGSGRAPASIVQDGGDAGGGETRTIESDLSDDGMHGHRVRVFRRQADAWVLAEERVDTRAERMGIATSTSEVTRYRNVAWHNLPGRDARRRARAAQAAAAAPRSGPGRNSRDWPSFRPATEAGAPAASLLGATPLLGAETTSAALPALNIGYVHGAMSTPAVWDRIRASMSQSYGGVQIAPALDWRAGLESQAHDLFNRLSATGATGFLLIGHSNGGLVARRTAQLSSGSAGSLVSGVIAISSPHAGVPLAKVGHQVVSDFLTAQLQSVVARIGGSCWRGQFSWLCSFATDAVDGLVPRIVTYALDDAAPFVRDDQPGSAFLATLNSTPERFRRYSLETASQGRWKFVRMFGDWICAPEDRCSGNHLQNMMESVYEVLRYCGSNTVARAKLGSLSDKCRDVRWTLSALDAQYERWTAPGDESDGLVPMRSQQYPGTVDQRYTKRNARDSHPGELLSGRIRDNVMNASQSFSTK